jgi:hypothetical protein
MAHMADQGAIRFVNGLFLTLTFDIIGLRNIDGDDTIGMPGEHAFLTDVALEFKRQTLVLIFLATAHRQIELQKRKENPALGDFEPVPRLSLAIL